MLKWVDFLQYDFGLPCIVILLVMSRWHATRKVDALLQKKCTRIESNIPFTQKESAPPCPIPLTFSKLILINTARHLQLSDTSDTSYSHIMYYKLWFLLVNHLIRRCMQEGKKARKFQMLSHLSHKTAIVWKIFSKSNHYSRTKCH